jgi:hypothetical protein
MTKNPVTEGTHEDHVNAGQQSHKNPDGAAPANKAPASDAKAGGQGGTHEQHVKAGEQSHKNSSDAASSHDDESNPKAGGQGGTHEQHVNAGKQSNKNS